MPFSKTYLKGRDWFIKDDHVELSKEYMEKKWNKFLKLTGSRFSSVLDNSQWATPVQLWFQIVGLFKEPIDKIYTESGNAIEPKVREMAAKKLGYDFKSYIGNNEGWDVFRDADPILGGIPDGEPIDKNGNIDYSNGHRMLEIKTTSIDSFKRVKDDKGKWVVSKDANNVPIVDIPGKGMTKWYNGDQIVIPENYKQQLALYLYLRGQTKGVFGVCFLQPEDYANPKDVDISKRKVVFVEYDLDKAYIEGCVKKAKDWYLKYVVKGVSPKFTESDIRWLKREGIL